MYQNYREVDNGTVDVRVRFVGWSHPVGTTRQWDEGSLTMADEEEGGGSRFCQPHWDKLREAIADRGMEHLIPQSGVTAAMQLVDALEREGEATPVNYDPLMGAWSALLGNLSNIIPTLIFMEGCPMCIVIDSGKHHGVPQEHLDGIENWIYRAADDQLGIATELGLMSNDK